MEEPEIVALGKQYKIHISAALCSLHDIVDEKNNIYRRWLSKFTSV